MNVRVRVRVRVSVRVGVRVGISDSVGTECFRFIEGVSISGGPGRFTWLLRWYLWVEPSQE